MKYKIELTEKQMCVVEAATEEYMRLRMGQDFDFCSDMAALNTDLSPENPRHEKIFDFYIARRDHLQELMKAFFRIAFEPTGHLKAKTDEMMICECIWDAIRVATGRSRWRDVFPIGSEPVPKIEKVEDLK